jgi:hypothetical protein
MAATSLSLEGNAVKRLTVESVSVVHELVCDSCDIVATRNETEFFEFTSIGYVAGYGSIFGDGSRVEIDLCQSCLRDALGAWLRVKDSPLVSMLSLFKPEIHGREFPDER